MKIGVSGASGHLGRAVVSELLQRPGGHEVVAITRTPQTVSLPAQGRFGDYNRPESLAEAYAGIDRLLIIPTLEPGNRAALIAKITGRPLAFLAITEEQLRAGLKKAGLPVEVVNIVVSIQ
jgi:NAD(P)H dehydrogenase (quinone)